MCIVYIVALNTIIWWPTKRFSVGFWLYVSKVCSWRLPGPPYNSELNVTVSISLCLCLSSDKEKETHCTSMIRLEIEIGFSLLYVVVRSVMAMINVKSIYIKINTQLLTHGSNQFLLKKKYFFVKTIGTF